MGVSIFQKALWSVLLIISLSLSTFGLEVTGWVPYYNQQDCYNNLTTTYGGISPGDVLTSIGLQFWRPTSGGNMEIVSNSESFINQFRQWGTDNGVKVYLTVFNNDGTSWNWSLAEEAFANNRTTFVNNLISEMERWNLDGVDLDLEGVGNLQDWGGEYAAFVSELSVALKARGKDLVIDTYWGSSYGGPNPDWWWDWVGEVDYIRPMIYQEGNDYWTVNSWAPTGIEITMGLPAWENSWAGATAEQNLQSCLDLDVGVALWDLQLEGSSWKSAAVWQKLLQIRQNGGDTGYGLDVTTTSGGTVTKNPSGAVYAAGTSVSLTAVPAAGYRFAGWSGDVSGTQTTISVTMNSDKDITATFELDGNVEVFDMLGQGEWTGEQDDFGSSITVNHTPTLADISYDVVPLPTGDWSWVSLTAYAEGDYTNLSSITITYTATKPMYISLYQPGPSDTGASYQYLLPASSSSKTVTIATADFEQPSWVSPTTPLNLSIVGSIAFYPGEDPTSSSGVAGSFRVTQLDVRGAVFTITPVVKSYKAPLAKRALTMTNNQLVIPNYGDVHGVTVYSVSGQVLKRVNGIEKSDKAVLLNLSQLTPQVIIVHLETKSGRMESHRQLIR